MMMRMSINGNDNWSVLNDDDQLMMIMSASTQQRLFDSKSDNHQSEGVKKQRRRRRSRKPKNTAGGREIQGKRKLTEHQGAQLELYFEREPKLETERKEKIALELGLEPLQVAVWFQNRRARWKFKKLEDEYANLRTSHHCVLTQKANLEAQVSELSGRLLEAECQIVRLSGRPLYESSGTPSISNSGNTPSSSSIIMSTMEHHVDKGFEAQDVQVLESEYGRVMDYYWMNNNIYDLM